MQPTQEANKPTKIGELNEYYTEADSVDKELFAEQRSNLLLIAGEHYSRRNAQVLANIRIRADLTQEQKIRLTKNHIQKITKIYVNNIVSAAPGLQVVPANDRDTQSKKSAKLRQSVWEYGKRRYKMKSKVRAWAKSYVGIGEVACKVFWDPSAGDFIGYEQQTDEQGNPVYTDSSGNDTTDQFDPQGIENSLKAGEKAVFSGDFVFETIHGFNLLRSPAAKNMEESPYLCIRKMESVKVLLATFGSDPEKKKFISEDQDKTFVVFDSQRSQYTKSKGQAMVREYYFRPSPIYPNGYYYITTERGILAEGELPFGVFPIAYAGFEKIETSCRARSPVKHMRNYQAEINRAASKIAEHQITLGDDKIVTLNGSKIEQGGVLPGVRGVKVTGQPPVILPGRSGDQYLAYAQSQIAELYDVMCVAESMADKAPDNGTVDPYALLFRSASKKKVFQEYIEEFEQFQHDVLEIFLKLAPHYYSDAHAIQIVGKREAVNLDELRDVKDFDCQIRLEEVSEDIDTQMGRQLVLNQAIQYAANQLGPEGVGKLIAAMPFASKDDVFADLTLDEDLADNIILSLERGKPHAAHEYDNNAYIIKRLTSRMREPDFELLSPQIQQAYVSAVNNHEQAEAEKQAKILAAKNEYIPTDGALIVCDMYVKDPKDPEASRRVRMPYSSLQWLIRQLELQGTSISELDQLDAPAGPDVTLRAAAMNRQSASARPTIPSAGGGQMPQPQAGGNLPEMPGAGG